MWFEILPSAVIIYAAFSVSTFGTYAIHKIFLGNAHKKDLRNMFLRSTYLRDRRLTNNPYKCNGLEAIPNEENNKEK